MHPDFNRIDKLQSILKNPKSHSAYVKAKKELDERMDRLKI